jgi:hypothetical protein
VPEIREQASRIIPEQIKHILDGDGNQFGGGHRYGTPVSPLKNIHTYFPKAWSDEKIIGAAQSIVADPNSKWGPFRLGVDGTLLKPDGSARQLNVTGVYDGLTIKVGVEPLGRGIVTAFPK